MRWRVFAGALLITALAVILGSPDARADPPPSPPAEYEALYSELSAGLTSFEAQLDSGWDGSVGTGQFAGGLSAANGNKTIGLLAASSWDRIIETLDAFEAMGVGLVKIDMQYPALTPAFHAWLAANPPPALNPYTVTVANFIGQPNSFYNRLADEVRSRGLGLWIEHSTLFADFTPTPPAGYFAGIRSLGLAATQARYTSEQAAEAALIVSQLAPDYYTVLDEPTTQAANFGYFPGNVPIFDADGWRDFAQDVVAAIDAAAPGSPALLGAGSGTWEGFGYTQRFAALPELDYIDFHMYPLATVGQSYLQNVLDWAEYVRTVAPAKKLTIGEVWLYKAGVADLTGGTPANDIFGRDVYSFWEPLDRQMLDVLYKVMHLEGFDAVMPFWSQYYFAYLTHGDPDLAGLSGLELLAVAAQEAVPNIASVTLTGTGHEFAELIAASDPDGDGWLTRDETTIGTLPHDACGFTPGGDPASETWPPDLAESNAINVSDVLTLKPVFGQAAPPVSARYDIAVSGGINVSDVLALKPFFGATCVP